MAGKKKATGNNGKNSGGGIANLKPFQPGQSGNPSGRPKGYAEFREKCREHTDAAVTALVDNLKDPEGSVRNTAASTLLAYGWGKPSQAVEVSGPDGKPVETKSEVMTHEPGQAARVLEVLARVGVVPPSVGAGGPVPGDDTAAD